ncbi:hypothetical protein F8M41_015542 [Gigaspora margarita]|uniref:F-box domain-containing protein n=1 Tax=Gigaspora margarita TaxID=4874 RepID=A0A8H4AQH8_GIGMA|nr:hypothetical protein F8M41_015542 [Gigaspora margarita]
MSSSSLPILPIECIGRIIEYQTDHKTLYSCLLLNRQCCRITAPILWSDPNFKNGKFFGILILRLNDFEKSFIPNIERLIPPDNELLFDYLTFVTKISEDLNDSINKWLELESEDNFYYIMMFLRTCNNLKKLEFKGNGRELALDLRKLFFNTLNQNNTLTPLSLINLPLGNGEEIGITRLLKKATLNDLCLSNNQFGGQTGKRFAKYLENILLYFIKYFK